MSEAHEQVIATMQSEQFLSAVRGLDEEALDQFGRLILSVVTGKPPEPVDEAARIRQEQQAKMAEVEAQQQQHWEALRQRQADHIEKMRKVKDAILDKELERLGIKL